MVHALSSVQMWARDVQDLAAFRHCGDLLKAIEAATATGNAAADAAFCAQITDGALDAVAAVAEGFVRNYPTEFARLLDDALTSLEDVRRRTEAGHRREYFTADQTSEILQLWTRADKAIRALRAYLWTMNKQDLLPRPQLEETPRERRKSSRRRYDPEAT